MCQQFGNKEFRGLELVYVELRLHQTSGALVFVDSGIALRHKSS